MQKFEVFEGADGRFCFRLRAGNGEIIAQSEGYTSRSHARRGVARLISIVTPSMPIEDV